MNEKLREKYIQNLDSIISYYEEVSEPDFFWVRNPESGQSEWSETGKQKIASFDVAYGFSVQALNAIWKICPSDSSYFLESHEIFELLGRREFTYDFILYNLIKRLRHDLELGFIGSISSLLHQEIFIDYLDMAQHLLDEGYKDASAVIAGSTLESHLRQLCIANRIDIDIEKQGKKQPKKASVMNADLKKDEVYSLYDQKMITAQLDIRNNAAHGKYIEYTNEDVERFIDWLRDFIDRFPA